MENPMVAAEIILKNSKNKFKLNLLFKFKLYIINSEMGMDQNP